MDAVFDSVSVATTFKDTLAKQGIIFGSFSDAVQDHPELVEQYLGTVVPHTDNYFAALNSAVFTDGSFCYIPKGVRCPMELSTYFRINAAQHGAVRAHAADCRRGRLRELPRGLHRTSCVTRTSSTPLSSSSSRWKARRSSTPRCRTGTRATRTASRRDLQLRHQARRVPRRRFEDLLDPGRDRLRHHLEVSELPAARAITSSASSTPWR